MFKQKYLNQNIPSFVLALHGFLDFLVKVVALE